jgi:diaminohydroxyphosphoribosylaminopyrimidine deaminase/5-amino-6-(5-phosphoribosylamino)uracil reductase
MNRADEQFMRECFRLSEKGRGFVSPNPLVGAVLVKAGRIVARGYHRRFGGLHAEIDCLNRYRGDCANATLYVNLEPCVHRGKTPPCVDRIIQSGLRRVVAAMMDPNPLVSGRGIGRLRKAGIRVDVGVLEDEARELNRHFVRYITARRPYVHVKIAQSVDGFIAARASSPRWISSIPSRTMVHRWRVEHDAVLVGAGTVLADDPRLDVRLVRGRSPAVVILDGRLNVPYDSRLLKRDVPIYLFAAASTLRRKPVKGARLRGMGVMIVPLRAGRGTRVALGDVLHELYRRNIGSVLVEGGSDVFAQFLYEGPVDELSIFLAPRVLGNGIPAFGLETGRRRFRTAFKANRMVASKVGKDILIQAYSDRGG